MKDQIRKEDISNLSFEKAVSELEGIVTILERGDVTLEDSISIYERGAALKQHCDTLLSSAENRIEQIKLNCDNDIQGVEPFDKNTD
ncbi:exodeoxyribonuclease VII small subunit [Candidatus Liberibacter americanus]|uniref:Exodeoxyribonuclease 7 small subunit n=1 Tax=Candidatus Liberibacter americanus str. Sao Paulo TaxID=1261131 RepID=U6B4B6_9HYPH|nr:exodeoxyribonuclease VII small subunit [Candidatus Liberibacter americanus]AHA27478.1 Exonuclease VII small subunit [Candidatus Liberibacter americanus str. Sao Paulo]EMS36561.1 exodeoxyribonuclease VII small subunit [Candidatus Liberibacter americanus PW_SP]